ncbi:putative nuclease HARBI1 [Eriocheir sinensis]|uniref:putative nuclease HARBI1 n=1 Tax=Eriocheir sinensis TaxID=95602 RepID=UPI0021C9ABA8|nr:putative nuclease HARBI1 [Eriocheir sinensis]
MAECQQARQRLVKTFQERRDVLNTLSDAELLKRYRLDRAGVLFVTDLVRGALQSPTSRSFALTPEMKVIITLRYLATGKMQMCNSDDLGPSQSSVSKAITDTLKALTQPAILVQFIRFPRTVPEIREKQQEFVQVANFPGIVGVIDCTHVRILAPREYEADYVNRKNFHSINTQLVFDAKYNILNVVANWPGSTHDARIWRESGLKRMFEDHHIPPDSCHLLGDSGYPCRRYLLTPFPRPQTDSQAAYNRAHKKTQSIVERGIGQLKCRFHVLHGEVRLNPEKTCQVILACALLHNICKKRNIQLPDENVADVDDNMEVEDEHQEVQLPQDAANGTRFREVFCNHHFHAEP